MQILKFILKLIPFNTLPNEKNLDVTKLKAFADDKLDVTKMRISMIEYIKHAGKTEKMWLPLVSFSHTVYQSSLL